MWSSIMVVNVKSTLRTSDFLCMVDVRSTKPGHLDVAIRVPPHTQKQATTQDLVKIGAYPRQNAYRSWSTSTFRIRFRNPMLTIQCMIGASEVTKVSMSKAQTSRGSFHDVIQFRRIESLSVSTSVLLQYLATQLCLSEFPVCVRAMNGASIGQLLSCFK